MIRLTAKWVWGFCLSCVLASAVSATDYPGSEDHALLSRFPDSSISWYDQQGFEPYRIAIGPVTGYRHIDQWLDVEGRITRINYRLEGERSFYEVYANYLGGIKKAGFEILAEGYDKSSSARGGIGQRGFLQVHYGANALPPGASSLLSGSSTSGGSGYFAARLLRPEGTVYVVVGIAQYAQSEIVTLVDIIEQQPLEQDLITVDAQAMSRDIDIYGKVALYGIYFDYDKATLTPASESALEEIAQLLNRRPSLQLYVVGHTDMKGSLDYNIRLSQQRAAAVVAALGERYGIDLSRLTAQGVGPLVPVLSNGADPGRAKNRRVELVQK